MSAAAFIQELESLPPDQPLDWPAFSQRINADFSAAETSAERSDLLAVRAVAIEIVINQLELLGEQLEKFTDACELEYKRLIVQETLVGGTVSYQQMLQVTDREIAAGRMSDDYALRAIALEESSGQAEADPIQPAVDQSSSGSRLARLKHWLHIE